MVKLITTIIVGLMIFFVINLFFKIGFAFIFGIIVGIVLYHYIGELIEKFTFFKLIFNSIKKIKGLL